MMQDTIYAPSSAVGGAIAVLRVSGPRAADAARLFDRSAVLRPRMLLFARATDGGETVDDCMTVFLPGPGTYTGEDMFEINCHGGPQTVQRLLGLLGTLGFRPAEGGEFTRRAFLNGKMDLSQAEAVMDVINAEAEKSLKAAVRQLEGSVSREIAAAERMMLDALAGIDAAIDYPYEAEADAYAELPEAIAAARTRLASLIADGRRGRVLRDGLRAAILGRPNVGKSSLLNALLGRERAIVTALAGTTRDILDEKTSFLGVPVRLIDTAGLRETANEAERIGVSRARDTLRDADVVCVTLDGSVPLTDEDARLLDETEARARVILLNKSDLPCACVLPDGVSALPVSAKTGCGLDAVKAAILALAAPERCDGVLITNERHLAALESALRALDSASVAQELDCKATDLRTALHALGTITGSDVDAAVIDCIFERFCVGK